MTESIYILTMLYAVYVIDDIEGVRIIVSIRDNLHIDLVSIHQLYRNIRDGVIKTVLAVIPARFNTA